MAETTCIRNIAWLIAWDGDRGRHHYLRDVDLAYAGDTVTFLGPAYDGSTEREIDGRALMVMPGLVNVHAGETITPRGGGVNVVVNVEGSVSSERDLVEAIRKGLLRAQQSGKAVVL